MLQSLFTKAIRDRWLGMTIAASVLVLFLFYTMALYRGIDLSIYSDLPEGMRELVGIPDGADVGTLAYSVMFGFTASLTLAGMAISIGSSSIAGEERNGTIGLLLANPKSRRDVLVSKAASMVLLTVAAVAVLWMAGRLIPAVLDVETGSAHVEAMMLHLGLVALFHGFLALAVGAWTGNRSLASSVAAGVMIVSYFAVGLLPLVEGLAPVAKVFPWYYFDGGDPLINGAQWDHLAVLGGGSVVLGVAGFAGLTRRDLRGRSTGVTLFDRLRADPRTRAVFERLAGSARVSRLWVKTTSEHQGLLIITAAVMFFVMGLLLGPIYRAMEESLTSIADDFPEALMAIAGGGDMSTPEGFFQIETFSLSAPIAVMLVTIVIGARGLAGEEARRTMGLLLANPIKRRTVVLEQALAMVIYGACVGLATFAGVAAGSTLSGLGMSLSGMAAASFLLTLLGLVFGSLALTLGAITGRVKVAIYGAVGSALVSHLLDSFLPLDDRLAGLTRWTPNHYYLSSEPLRGGMAWGHAAILAGLIVVLLAIAVFAFDRRDLRQG